VPCLRGMYHPGSYDDHAIVGKAGVEG
jgi:hypothetical protein